MINKLAFVLLVLCCAAVATAQTNLRANFSGQGAPTGYCKAARYMDIDTRLEYLCDDVTHTWGSGIAALALIGADTTAAMADTPSKRFVTDTEKATWNAGGVGPQGPPGPQGIQGLPGANSIVPGPAGAPGAQGPIGLTGNAGAQGSAGTAGAQGIQGIPGTNGTNGAQGIQGIQGPIGNTGPAGPATTDASLLTSGTVAFARGGRAGAAATPATTGTMSVSMTTAVVTVTPTGAATFNATGGTIGQTVTFVVTTAGTVSFVLTWGTNFRKVGTLATGTVAARTFAVTFICTNGTLWVEIARTAVQT